MFPRALLSIIIAKPYIAVFPDKIFKLHTQLHFKLETWISRDEELSNYHMQWGNNCGRALYFSNLHRDGFLAWERYYFQKAQYSCQRLSKRDEVTYLRIGFTSTIRNVHKSQFLIFPDIYWGYLFNSVRAKLFRTCWSKLMKISAAHESSEGVGPMFTQSFDTFL